MSNRLNPSKERKLLIFFIGFFLIGIIGLIDYWTGYEYAFSLFYVFPISIIAWMVDQRIGFAAAITSAIVWFLADLYSGHPYSQTYIPYWNTLIRLAFFVLITYLLSSLKGSLEREKELSRKDFLTGAANSRYFYEVMQVEFNRHRRSRHPFTVAYVDIDNFKLINDESGHAEGDMFLKNLVSSIKKRIRSTDIIARLGGDEFALFFPETDMKTAPLIIKDIFKESMPDNGKPITFSIGVVTYDVPPRSIDEIIKNADELMYTAKYDGKSRIKYSEYKDELKPEY